VIDRSAGVTAPRVISRSLGTVTTGAVGAFVARVTASVAPQGRWIITVVVVVAERKTVVIEAKRITVVVVAERITVVAAEGKTVVVVVDTVVAAVAVLTILVVVVVLVVVLVVILVVILVLVVVLVALVVTITSHMSRHSTIVAYRRRWLPIVLVASVTLLNLLLRSRSQRQILLVFFRENGLAFQREPLLDKLLLSALSLLLDHGTIFDLRVLVQLAFAALSTRAVFGHVRTVMLFVLPSEVIAQRLIAQVALHEPATTRHLVTTFILDERSVAFKASPDDGLGHSFLRSGAQIRLVLGLHLVARQTQMPLPNLLAQFAGLFLAARVVAFEDFVAVGDDAFKIAKWALMKLLIGGRKRQSFGDVLGLLTILQLLETTRFDEMQTRRGKTGGATVAHADER